MRIFMTGATGFIGGRTAALLREQGHEVVALVRDEQKADALWVVGCELVSGTLEDGGVIREAMDGCDAVIHGAAIYEMGIPRARRRMMRTTNVTGTRTVLTAAHDAGIAKVVYVSSVVAFGNTDGDVVDESHKPVGLPSSCYEETKREAHVIAQELIVAGLPCVIVQPGGVYGPEDHSALGDQLLRAAQGRLAAIFFPESQYVMVHVDDVAAGIVLALQHGVAGESYVLGGEVTTMRRMVRTAAELGGCRPPRVSVPDLLVRAAIPLAPLVTRALRVPPNLSELVASTADATYLATDAKARRELGYEARGLEAGLADMLRVELGVTEAAAATG